jgi:hypothetical protein
VCFVPTAADGDSEAEAVVRRAEAVVAVAGGAPVLAAVAAMQAQCRELAQARCERDG